MRDNITTASLQNGACTTIYLIIMNKEITISGLEYKKFESIIDNKKTALYALTNSNGCELTVCNYGARIISLLVPDRDGNMVDVVTGHDSIEAILKTDNRYYGVVCGRYANRIARGRFEIDGNVYDKLAINNGPNNLHGGVNGFNAKVWDAEQVDAATLVLRYTSPDGEEGFPGNLATTVTYRLTEENSVEIYYEATTDKDTVVNLTNHAFFNLSGVGKSTVDDHILTINASHYLPTDNTAIPYGEPAPVAGTPMSFVTPHTIGERIDEPFEQLIFGHGYDHCYVLDKGDGTYGEGARCISPRTGITLTVLTTEPGIQLYTANWLKGEEISKHGKLYHARTAFCLETQHYPDSPNRPQYPTTLLRAGETFKSHTTFAFSISNL